MTRLSHRRILILLIITPVLLFLELSIGFAVFGGIRQINEDQAHATRLENYIRTNTRFVSLAESSQRGFLLTGDHRYSDSFEVYRAGMIRNKLYYDTLPATDKTPALLAILTTSQHKFAEMTQTLSYYNAGHKDSAMAVVASGEGKLMMDSIRQMSASIRSGLTTQIAVEQKHEDRLFIYFFVLIAVLIVLSMAVVYYTYMKFASYTQRLEVLVNNLEQANERMSAYTNMSYHELKTPLRNIHGFAQLLKVRHINGGNDPEQDEFIRHITDGVRQMNRTIDDMREKYLSKP